jgi:flagellar hook-basal body complex protein FliE
MITAIGSGMMGATLNAQQLSGKTDNVSFTEALQKAAEQVNALQNNAATQSQMFALGQTNDIHSVMISAQKATVALELTTQVRNRVLEAYSEVMRMSM